MLYLHLLLAGRNQEIVLGGSWNKAAQEKYLWANFCTTIQH
jgi:hypothetical protein